LLLVILLVSKMKFPRSTIQFSLIDIELIFFIQLNSFIYSIIIIQSFFPIKKYERSLWISLIPAFPSILILVYIILVIYFFFKSTLIFGLIFNSSLTNSCLFLGEINTVLLWLYVILMRSNDNARLDNGLLEASIALIV
jgi:hypothetical protein